MNINQRKAGAILSYASIIVTTAVTLIYTPIMLRYLGKTEYGVYDLTVSIVSYLSLLSLGFGGSYVKFYYQYKVTKDEDNLKKLNGLFLIVYLIMGIISLIIGSFLIKNLEVILTGKMKIEEIILSKQLMKILVINIFFTFPATVFEAYITANEEFIFQRIVVLARQLLSPLISIPLLMLGYRSIGLVLVTTLLTILSFVLNVYYSTKRLNMRFSFRNVDMRLLKDIAVFSSFLFINMITDQINWSIDKFVLGKFVGTLSITIYSMGSLINKMYISISLAISSVFIPKVNFMVQNDASNKEITELLTKIGRIQYYVIMLVLLGFITFGSYFITNIWLDKTFIKSFYVAALLIVPVTIPSIQNIGLEIQKAKNMHKFRSLVYLIIAIVNLLVSIPLAVKYGPVGSAIGTGFAIIVGNGFIMNMYYKKSMGIDISYFWINIINVTKGLIIPLIYTFYIKINGITSNVQFIYRIFIYIIIYLISIYFISMNLYEKEQILGPIYKFINKIYG